MFGCLYLFSEFTEIFSLEKNKEKKIIEQMESKIKLKKKKRVRTRTLTPQYIQISS